MTRTRTLAHWTTTAAAALATASLTLPAFGQSTDLGAGGFSISQGGEVIAGATPPVETGHASVDETLRRLNLDVRFDSLSQDRQLSISTADMRDIFEAGEVIHFHASMNYPAFIERAELRILDRWGMRNRVVNIVPMTPNGVVSWQMPTEGDSDFAYVLRVYDRSGRFDETVPAILRRAETFTGAPEDYALDPLPGDGIGRRHIPLRGGTVMVTGSNAVPGDTLTVLGDEITVDETGQFTVTRILPVGDNVIEVRAYGQRLLRDVHVPQSDWFSTGIIDVTAGLTDGDTFEDDGGYVDGRAAFYVSGQTAGGWRVTASADTTDGPIDEMFSRLDDRDPSRVLDALREDGSDLYPTYGDDSTWYDSTPTSGNVYVRVENDTTAVTFGDFTSSIEGPGLLRSSRDLYGLDLSFGSAGVTTEGDPRLLASAYAAQPDSLSQRDVFRGTGGSVYFLSRREIIAGSSRVTVEETDADTGFVVATRTLVEGVDYELDAIQGVVILSQPLASGGDDGTLVSGASAEREMVLVVQYEYLATGGGTGDMSFGGRVEGWIGNDLRIGATVLQDQTAGGEHTTMGADALLRFGSASYFEVEAAQSDGPGFGRATSTDGGLTIASTGGVAAMDARALEARLGIDLEDLGLGTDGTLRAWAQIREEGFETLTEDTPADQALYGVSFDIGLGERLRFGLDAEDFEVDGGESRQEGEIRLAVQITDSLTLAAALAHLDQNDPLDPTRTGERTDAVLRADYAPRDGFRLYGYAQQTLDITGGLDRNDRVGIGIDADIGERVTVGGEISGGDGGTAGEARIAWRPSEENEVYLGYTLDPTRSPSFGPMQDRGRIVVGSSYQYSERLQGLSESSYDLPSDERAFTQAHSMLWTPSDALTLSAGFEAGEIRDSADGDFDRFGLSLGAVWAPDEARNARVRLEYRTEDGDGTTRDNDVWALTSGYSRQVAEDWRLIADLDMLLSDNAESALSDAEYLRFTLGYAYRPIGNERLNVLFRASYLHDFPAQDQLGADGAPYEEQHRAGILSVAANYDIDESLTVTGLLAYRSSEIADRDSDDFVADTAVLSALRFDWHVAEYWSLMAEGRVLNTVETDGQNLGALLGVYRHIDDRLSLGLGYEWGSVSDDAAAIDYEGQGWFLNLVGRF